MGLQDIDAVTAGLGLLLALVLSTLVFVYRTVKSLPPLQQARHLVKEAAGHNQFNTTADNSVACCVQGVVAFFHPFADGGGGGERVLW
jgi:hypothetical protein